MLINFAQHEKAIACGHHDRRTLLSARICENYTGCVFWWENLFYLLFFSWGCLPFMPLPIEKLDWPCGWTILRAQFRTVIMVMFVYCSSICSIVGVAAVAGNFGYRILLVQCLFHWSFCWLTHFPTSSWCTSLTLGEFVYLNTKS